MFRRVAILAGLDLWHEKLLTLCMLLALGAVISPVLILYGLKRGMIDAMRYQLVSDPEKREIRPISVPEPLGAEWFDTIRKREDVAFVAPQIGIARSSVSLRSAEGIPPRKVSDIDAYPSGEGDALLAHYGVKVPGIDEISLSHFVAKKLGVVVGDQLVLMVQAQHGITVTDAELMVSVAGILPEKATDSDRVFLDIAVLDAVDDFKSGFAVPAFGWEGGGRSPPEMFGSAFVTTDSPLPPRIIAGLVVRTGFSQHYHLTPDLFREQTECNLSDDANVVQIHRLDVIRRAVALEDLDGLQRRLGGAAGSNRLFSWNDPRSVSLKLSDSTDSKRLAVELSGASQSMIEAGVILPEGVNQLIGSPFTLGVHPSVLTIGAQAVCQVETKTGVVEFPVLLEPIPDLPQGQAWCDATLLAKLKYADERQIKFDTERSDFVKSRTGHWAFRLYARDIDSVERLHKYLQSLGIDAQSEEERIREIRDLDAYLAKLFLIIAFVAAAGGGAALLASLASTVQRKTRELGILRLLGIPRISLCLYTVTQGVLLAIFSLGVAFAYFQIFSTVIDRLFVKNTNLDERFCVLHWNDAVPIFVAVVIIAAAASAISGLRILFIEPSEALRDE